MTRIILWKTSPKSPKVFCIGSKVWQPGGKTAEANHSLRGRKSMHASSNLTPSRTTREGLQPVRRISRSRATWERRSNRACNVVFTPSVWHILRNVVHDAPSYLLRVPFQWLVLRCVFRAAAGTICRSSQSSRHPMPAPNRVPKPRPKVRWPKM